MAEDINVFIEETEKNAKVHELFSTPLGQEVHAILKDDFVDRYPYQPNQNQNLQDTVFFLGASAAIRSIDERIAAHVEHLDEITSGKAPRKPRNTNAEGYI